MKHIIFLGLLAVLMLGIPCQAAVEYHKDPTGYAEGAEVGLKVYIHEISDELRLKVQKIDGEDFWSDGRMRFYRDGQQIDTVLYYAGDSYVDTEVPLDFTLETHEYRARADTFDGSGNQFWTGTVDVWGEWQSEGPLLTDHQAGDEFENEYYDENSSNPNIHIDEGSCIEVEVDSGEFDLHSDGSSIDYRFWRSPELEFIDINSAVSRVTLHSDVDPGTYYVTAYAGNGEGKIDSDTIEVVVSEPVPPTPTPTATPTPLPPNLDMVLMLTNETGSGKTELHVCDHQSNYQSSSYSMSTILHQLATDRGYIQMVDFRMDGDLDMVLILTNGTGSGKTEIHVLDGSRSYQSFECHLATSLHEFSVDRGYLQMGDFRMDGDLDMVLMLTNGTGSGKTEIHVLDGSRSYQSFECHLATSLHEFSVDRGYLQMGDFRMDGDLDMVLMLTNGTGSGKTEIHVLDGSRSYQSFECHLATSLHEFSVDRGYLQMGDFRMDGDLDMVLMLTNGTGSGKTEIHVLDGSRSYQSFECHLATGVNEFERTRGYMQMVEF